MHKLIGNEQSLVTDPGTSAAASSSASEQNARPENGPRSAWSSLALHDKGTELFAAHATGSLVTPPASAYKAAVISRDESIVFPLSPVHPAQARHFASHLSPPSFSGIDAIQDQMRQGKVIKYLRCQLVSLDWKDDPSYPSVLDRISLTANPAYKTIQAKLEPYILSTVTIPANHTVSMAPTDVKVLGTFEGTARFQSNYIVRAEQNKVTFNCVIGGMCGFLLTAIFSSNTPCPDLVVFFMHGQTGTWHGLPITPNGGDVCVQFPDKIFWIPTKPSSLEEMLPRHPESRLAQLFGGTDERFQMLEDVTTHANNAVWQFSDAASKKMCAHCGINPQPATTKCTGCSKPICSMCNNFQCTRA